METPKCVCGCNYYACQQMCGGGNGWDLLETTLLTCANCGERYIRSYRGEEVFLASVYFKWVEK